MPDLKSRFRGADGIPAPGLWTEIERREPSSSPPGPSLARRGVIAAFALGIAIAAFAFAVRAIDDGDGPRPVSPPSPQPIVPHANGQILFRIGGGDGPSWTDTIQPDGTGRRTFIPPEEYSSNKTWSPDGAQLAYVDLAVGGSKSADGYPHFAIMVADADGSNARELSRGVNDRWPPWLTWSPDGTQIAFSSLPPDDPSDNCIPGGDFMCPTDIYVMNVDGSGIHRITNDPMAEFQPIWSPDGTRIAFVRQTDATSSATGVFVMDADGSNRMEVAVTDEGSNFSPSWSPDGSQLVFSSIRNEDWQIDVVNADGSGEHPILAHRGAVGGSVWSPDGRLIAFVGEGGLVQGGGGDTALHVMRPDGTGITKLADEPKYGVAGDIAWQPLPAPTTVDATPTSPAPVPESGDPLAEVPEGWSELPPPPEVRSQAATAWTGQKLLIWGGYVFDGTGDKPANNDGFVFDARRRSWSAMPESPLSSRSAPASAWTGSELLIWGGWDGTYDVGGVLDDGAAFDPLTGAWRPLPPAPITARAPFSVWTGREMIVWGAAVQVDGTQRDGAAYDPASDSWRTIPEAPIDLTDGTAIWTGREMIVFGGALLGQNQDTLKAIGAAYDPSADTWRRLPDSTLSPQASTVAWDGREMIAWDYLNGSAAYDPVNDSWRQLPKVPVDTVECVPQSIAIGHDVVGLCASIVVFERDRDRWAEAEPPRSGFMEPAAAGEIALVPTRLGSGKIRMLAFRPPVS
jgi:hypothetical protein